MLGLSRSISNRTGTLSLSPPPPEPDYELGEAGVSPNSIVYAFSSNEEGEGIAYEFSEDSFLHLDPTSENYPSTLTFSEVIDEVEAAVYSPGYADWEVVEANSGFTSSHTDYVFSNNEDSFLETSLENWMHGHFFSVLGLDTYIQPTFDAVTEGNYASNPNIMVAFRIPNTSGFFLMKAIPPTAPPATDFVYHLLEAGNWAEVLTVSGTIGELVHQTNDDGEYINYVLVATHRQQVETVLLPSLTPVPQVSINVYDSSQDIIPNGIDFGALAAYGDVLEPNRLLDSPIDRYVSSASVNEQDDYADSIVPANNLSALAVTTLSDGATIPSISVSNRQITIKVIFANQVKPADPWYDNPNNETLKCRINIAGLRDNSTVANFHQALAVRNENSIITANQQGNGPLKFSYPIAGVTTYFAVHTFVFDVSSVPVYSTDEEKTALGISGTVTALDVAYDLNPEAGIRKHRAQIFKIIDVAFGTNLRSFHQSLQGNKTFQQILVPTIDGFDVGDTVGTFMLDTQAVIDSGVGDAVMTRSTKSGFPVPASENDKFKWEFNMSSTADTDLITLNSEKQIAFDTRLGAANENSTFIYLYTEDQQTEFSGDLTLSIDKSVYSSDPNIALELYLRLDSDDIDVGAAPAVTTVGSVDTYNWNFSKTLNLQGADSYTVKQEVRLIAKVVNGSRPAGDYVLTLSNGSTFNGIEDQTVYQSPLPATDPEDLTGQAIRPVPKYYKY
jgi:hypothetical protein